MNHLFARFIEGVEEASRRCWRLLTPDTTPEERKELAESQTWKGAQREKFEKFARAQQAWIHRIVGKVAQENRATEHKAVDGLGEKVGSIPYPVYMQMRALYGDNCWDDPEFMEAFFRDNPQLRVATRRGTRGQEYSGHNHG
jgi:hypothetical protein